MPRKRLPPKQPIKVERPQELRDVSDCEVAGPFTDEGLDFGTDGDEDDEADPETGV